MQRINHVFYFVFFKIAITIVAVVDVAVVVSVVRVRFSRFLRGLGEEWVRGRTQRVESLL